MEYQEVKIIVTGENGMTYTATFPKCKMSDAPWEIEYADTPIPDNLKSVLSAMRHIDKMKFVFSPVINEETLEYGQIVVDRPSQE